MKRPGKKCSMEGTEREVQEKVKYGTDRCRGERKVTTRDINESEGLVLRVVRSERLGMLRRIFENGGAHPYLRWKDDLTKRSTWLAKQPGTMCAYELI